MRNAGLVLCLSLAVSACGNELTSEELRSELQAVHRKLDALEEGQAALQREVKLLRRRPLGALFGLPVSVPGPIVAHNLPGGPDVLGTNLARTSLASVTASSVNGDGAFDNQFHGVTNAFDGGENWINGINYTYWLCGAGDDYPFIEVAFDVPATVRCIRVESNSAFVVTVFDSRGEEVQSGAVLGGWVPGEAIEDVSYVRLSFRRRAFTLLQVDEVEVYGEFPADAEFTVQRPRIGGL